MLCLVVLGTICFHPPPPHFQALQAEGVGLEFCFVRASAAVVKAGVAGLNTSRRSTASLGRFTSLHVVLEVRSGLVYFVVGARAVMFSGGVRKQMLELRQLLYLVCFECRAVERRRQGEHLQWEVCVGRAPLVIVRFFACENCYHTICRYVVHGISIARMKQADGIHQELRTYIR